MGYSDEARKAAAIARKIKHRLGQAAYDEFKRTGRIPAGLDEAVPSPRRATTSVSRGVKRAARTVPSSPGRLPSAPKRTELDLKHAEIASKLRPLSDPPTFRALSARSLSPNVLNALAREQARNSLSDHQLLDHYNSSKVFQQRGFPKGQLADLRNKWYTGEPVPLWTLPKGTPVAVYRDDKSTVPDVIGRITDTPSRKGPEGFSFPLPYVQVQDDKGRFYEYPALLSGSSKSPHARHPSFAAVEPIARGNSGIAQAGWGFPNFYEGENAGPSAVPDNIEKLAENILRALNFAESVEDRKRRKAIAERQASSVYNRVMNDIEDHLDQGGSASESDLEHLQSIVDLGGPQEKLRAGELLRLLRRRGSATAPKPATPVSSTEARRLSRGPS